MFGGEWYEDLFSIDLTTYRCTELHNIGSYYPCSRIRFNFFSIGESLFLYSGIFERIGSHCKGLWEYDLRKALWTYNPEIQYEGNKKRFPIRYYGTATAVKENSFRGKVYLIGGLKHEILWQKNIDVFSILTEKGIDLYWSLHFLKIAGIQELVGLNMIQEIIEMLE